ncbi:UDP-N-acetylmuramoyl-L-alanine--D-glutamate ligase [Candidatus Saccharibacteria bacterium]|nr:UDP-N-acetylmuramoyl-L-alanine--D-glutamate ligase [Candidatus Saccharibacteria bacterium]
MNVLILGYGLEGKSVENYFKNDSMLFEHTNLDILDNFKKEELLFKDYSKYDLIFRTPSIPPKFIPVEPKRLTSVTKFFFENSPAPIIGVTGTKGKGTTCSLIKSLLKNLLPPERNIYLVGNIGLPALDVLPDLTKSDVVIYELSSFQLWDLEKSPSISVVLRIEQDHLDVHENFEEYLSAKKNIVKFQTPSDFCIYFKDNKNTNSLVKSSASKKLPYPLSSSERPANLDELLSTLNIPGAHNKENAESALLATFAYFKKFESYKDSFENFLSSHSSEIKSAFSSFKPLPHHIEFVRELNQIKYYDDSFSTVLPSLEAAIKSFPKTPLVLIAGGKDKGFDLALVKRLIFDNPYLIKAVLIGETANKLADGEDPEKYFLAGNDFEKAILSAKSFAEEKLESEELNSDTCLIDAKPKITPPVVLLSPCASSFDMFESYKQRGDIFKQIVNNF